MKFYKSRNNTLLFMLGYFCILIAFLFTCTTYPNTYGFINILTRNLRIIGYFFCVLKILLNLRLYKRQFIFLATSLVIILIVTYITDMIVIITDLLVIIAANGIEIKKIIRFDFYSRLIFMVFTYFSFLRRIIPEVVDYRDWIFARHSYGFSHPNRLGVNLFVLCIYLFYLKHGSFKAITYGFMSVVLYISYFVISSRTASMGITVIIFTEILNRISNEKLFAWIEKKSDIIYKASFWIPMFLSFILSFFGAIGIINYKKGSSISSRIVLAGRGLVNYGVSLFGQRVKSIGIIESQRLGVDATVIDNTYIYLLVNYGIFVFTIVMAIFYTTLRESKQNEDYVALICMVIIMLMATMEAPFINIESNLFMIYSGVLFIGANNYSMSKNMGTKNI